VLPHHPRDAFRCGLHAGAFVNGLDDHWQVRHRHLVHVGVDAAADAVAHDALCERRTPDAALA
jgi:hypothetical protein